MISRQCPECEQVWFSANTGLWQCPGCGTCLSVKDDVRFVSDVTEPLCDMIMPFRGRKSGGAGLP